MHADRVLKKPAAALRNLLSFRGSRHHQDANNIEFRRTWFDSCSENAATPVAIKLPPLDSERTHD